MNSALPSRRILLALAAALTLSLLTLPVGDAAASTSTAPDATAAAKKKKCKKGYRLVTVKKNGKRIKRCRKGRGPNPPPPPVDPRATAQQLISGQQFFRVFASANSSGEEIWRFCANGTYFRRSTFSGQVTTSESLDRGTWSLSNAAAAPSLPGAVVATLALAGTFDGQQRSGNIAVGVHPGTAQSLINYGNGDLEFQRSAAQATC